MPKTYSREELVEIGRITRPHGIRGEVCVDYNAESFDLLDDSVYLLGRDLAGREKLTEYSIRGLRQHKGRPLISFSGIPDRTAAEALRNHALLVPLERLPEPDEDEVYLRDLPGLQVYSASEDSPNKRHLGLLESVADVAGQEIWTIRTEDGKEILFPASENFVLGINLDAGEALIAPPPGLIELYLGE